MACACRVLACRSRCSLPRRRQPRLEREQLAALARQLDLIDRLAEHAANTAPQERARYHFDYARLRADLKRVRAGLQDYLVPQRAQPRDPVPLAGDYVRRDRADDEEPSP
jgi:RAQPRD family integrative conjugative element protein